MVSVTRKWPPISGQRPNCTCTSYHRWGAVLLVGSAGFRFLFNPVARLGHHIASPNFSPNHSTLSTYLSMLFEFNPPTNQLDPTVPSLTATRAPPIPLTTHFLLQLNHHHHLHCFLSAKSNNPTQVFYESITSNYDLKLIPNKTLYSQSQPNRTSIPKDTKWLKPHLGLGQTQRYYSQVIG